MSRKDKGRKWDGKSRVSTDNYRKRWNEIFKSIVDVKRTDGSSTSDKVVAGSKYTIERRDDSTGKRMTVHETFQEIDDIDEQVTNINDNFDKPKFIKCLEIYDKETYYSIGGGFIVQEGEEENIKDNSNCFNTPSRC